MIKIAAENSARLLRLVDNILDLEQLESSPSLLRKPCNLADLMLKAGQHLQVIADQRGIKLAITPLTQLLNVDADRILQVLVNLFSNAIKFSSPGQTIWLTAKADDLQQWLVMQVKDEAMGIAPEQLETIFDRFHQVPTTNRHQGSVGLGLAICRSIIEQHNGIIWAESIVGQGSCFYVKLPL
jgi:signal transduction histidine kinase